MAESCENALQITVAVICLSVGTVRAVRTREKAWILLSAFYGCWALGDLYWGTFLIFFQRTPPYSYVPEFSWYSSYLLLFLLLRQLLPAEAWRIRGALPWLGVVIAAGMCAFYLQWGGVLSNLICAVLMGLLMLHAIRGLTFIHGSDRRYMPLCAAVLLFCFAEYATWTASCFWYTDDWTSPYLFADTLITLSFIPLLPAVRRAVRA